MAIGATAVFEYRSGGNNDNSGGFDAGISGAGTDYTLQDAAQLTLTDLACASTTTTLTSATGGFTSAMVGNSLYLKSGTNLTAGNYFVTAYTDTNTVTLDRSPTTGGDMSNVSGKLGGAWAVPLDRHGELAVGGNIFWLKGAVTYTLTEAFNIASTSSTFSDPIIMQGYNTTRGDCPTGDDRPTIAGGTSYFVRHGQNWHIKHLIVTGTTDELVYTGDYNDFYNCKIYNSTASSDKKAIYCNITRLTECEIRCTNGYGAYNNFTIIMCTFINTKTCIYAPASYTGGSVFLCVFDTFTTGIRFGGSDGGQYVYGCSFYSGTTAITVNTSKRLLIMKNIFSTLTNGISDSSAGNVNRHIIRDNYFYSVTNKGVNVTLDSSNIEDDPEFTDPANSDFTLLSTSPCLSAGTDMTNMGLVGDYGWNIGFSQNKAGGGSDKAAWVF